MASAAATRHDGRTWSRVDPAGVAAGLLQLVDQAIFLADGSGRIIEMNEAAAALSGAAIDETIGQCLVTAFPLRHASTGDAIFPLGERAVSGCVPAFLPGQRGEFRLDWRPARATDGSELTVFILIDETPTRALERALRARETTDPITGLLNRQQFEARIDVALTTCRDSANPAHALCHLDIDHFRLVNDALGPAAGDRLLGELAATIAALVRPGDAIGRIGDSSFGVIFDGLDVRRARQRAEEIAAAIAASGFEWDQRAFDLSCSVGIVELSADGPSAAEVLRQAGLACLQAKRDGRGQIVIGDTRRLAPLHVRQLAIGSSIKEAMAAGRISLAGQDIVSLAPVAPAARYFELLLRMSDAEGRLTSAGDLIGAAERFDLMRPIDRWVLEEVLDRLGGQIAVVPGLSISINLSGSSLSDASFLPYLLGMIARSPVDPTALTFELTETEVLRHAETAHRAIDAVHDAGCRIALDDFGVGLSNFDYLQRFPVDIVKIDGSFVRNMLMRPRDAIIVEAVISLAQRLGVQTVVEHVETAGLLDRAISLGADFVQGHHVGRPRPFTAILDELAIGDLTRRVSGRQWDAGPILSH